jgi:RNA polymerase sigma factor (sigma-70 family)
VTAIAELRQRLDSLGAFDAPDAQVVPDVVEELNAADHLGLVRQIAVKFVFQYDDLEETDAYQDGLLGLVKAVQTFDSDLGYAFSTWASRLIRNAIIDEHRKRDRIVGGEPLSQVPLEVQDVCLAEQEQPALPVEMLDAFLTPVPGESENESLDRRILVRHYLDGETWAKIGREMGITREAVRKRGDRAIEKIRERFADAIMDVLGEPDVEE